MFKPGPQTLPCGVAQSPSRKSLPRRRLWIPCRSAARCAACAAAERFVFVAGFARRAWLGMKQVSWFHRATRPHRLYPWPRLFFGCHRFADDKRHTIPGRAEHKSVGGREKCGQAAGMAAMAFNRNRHENGRCQEWMRCAPRRLISASTATPPGPSMRISNAANQYV